MIRLVAATITELEPKRRRALELVLSGSDLGEVAIAVGVNRATLWRWRQSPEWQQAIASQRSERIEDVVANLEAAALAHARYVRRVSEGAEVGEPNRLRAGESALARIALMTPDAQSRVRDALEAAAGGAEALQQHLGAQLAAAWGFTPKVGA